MSKFCPECGSPLESDAIFCADCGAASRTFNAGAHHATVGVAVLARRHLRAVPAPILAGVIEVFFAAATVIIFLVSGLTGMLSGLAGSLLGQRSAGTFELALAVLALAQFSVQVTLVVGLLELRKWARSLYLLSIGPIIGVTLLLVAEGVPITSVTGFIAGVVWVGTTALQVYLVVTGEHDFTL